MSTTPTQRAHLVAVVDSTDDTATLPIARDTVEAGGRATVVVRLGRADRDHIREYADAERLTSGEAESRYLDALEGQIRREVGDATIVRIADATGTSARALSRLADDATHLAIPSSLARRRAWRRALAHTALPVTVTPTAA